MSAEQLQQQREQLLALLRDPIKVRFLAVGAVLCLGYGLIYGPMQKKVQLATRQLARERARGQVARDIHALREEVAAANSRVMHCRELNEWVERLVDATRQAGVTMRTMEMRPTRQLGPYHVLALRVELDATYESLRQYVAWIEEPRYANRIDNMRVKREQASLTVNLDILGLVEVVDAPKP